VATGRPAPQQPPIPTARDVHIMMTSMAESDNVAYFGNDAAMTDDVQKGAVVDAASGGAVLGL
jgi:hypothetical protein